MTEAGAGAGGCPESPLDLPPFRTDTGLLPTARQIETTPDGHEVFAEDAVRSLIGALGLRNR
ncbi:hypothetical protein GCM10009789_69620 [Kribbella sancticallisti]|uniref:Uncharacterized protein n=1 Tax=Kribbella sancticallisti TaxID=460087 RepID=A0ABN2EHW7_9ACTN